MELSKQFQKASSSNTIQIGSMEVDRKYPIVRAERAVTKFGKTILLYLRESPSILVKVFLPTRYSSVFTDDDVNSVNSGEVSVNLVYRETCPKTKSYMLAVEQ